MNTAKKFTTIHLLLNKIDVLEVVIFLVLMMMNRQHKHTYTHCCINLP